MSYRGVVISGIAGCLLAGAAFAQDAEHVWDKNYPVSGKPTLTIETGDSNLEVRSCSGCQAVRIHVDSGRKLSEFRLEESQQGDHVNFSLKEKPHAGIGMNVHVHERGPRVTVEMPQVATLDATTSDGSLNVADLHGDVQVHASDGDIALNGVQGNLRLQSADGNVEIRDGSGSIDARSGDGHMNVSGHYDAVQLHTSDGNLEFSLADGAQLSAASRVETSDGRVTIRVPRTLAADVDVTTSDGKIDCSLPLTMDHYNSNDGGTHHVHGKLNAGGVPLTIHTADGNVTIASL